MVNSKQKVLVIRHGEGHHNTEGFYSCDPSQPGYIEAHLTDKGRKQVAESARALSEHGLNGQNILHLVSSPLPRTIETAKLLLEGVQMTYEGIETDKRAIDASFGQREGTSLHLYYDHDRWFPDNPSSFGGEERDQIRVRIINLYNELVEAHKGSQGYIIIVSHGVPLFLLVEAITGKRERLPTAGYRILPAHPITA